MISFEIIDRDLFDPAPIIRMLAPHAIDLRPFADEAQEIVRQDIIDKALAGEDANGNALLAVMPRTGKYKGMTGPPLAPQGASSRIIADLLSTNHETDPTDITIVTSWPGFEDPPILSFHAGGFVPPYHDVRDVIGLRPEAVDELSVKFFEYTTNIAARMSRGGGM